MNASEKQWVCENKKIIPSFTTAIAKMTYIRVENPDALYRDFSPNYYPKIDFRKVDNGFIIKRTK